MKRRSLPLRRAYSALRTLSSASPRWRTMWNLSNRIAACGALSFVTLRGFLGRAADLAFEGRFRPREHVLRGSGNAQAEECQCANKRGSHEVLRAGGFHCCPYPELFSLA